MQIITGYGNLEWKPICKVMVYGNQFFSGYTSTNEVKRYNLKVVNFILHVFPNSIKMKISHYSIDKINLKTLHNIYLEKHSGQDIHIENHMDSSDNDEEDGEMSKI